MDGADRIHETDAVPTGETAGASENFRLASASGACVPPRSIGLDSAGGDPPRGARALSAGGDASENGRGPFRRALPLSFRR